VPFECVLDRATSRVCVTNLGIAYCTDNDNDGSNNAFFSDEMGA
jgi:hypothetical protein